MGHAETARQQKITFGEMRESGIDRLLIYCADFRCSYSIQMSADRWPDHVRLSGIEPLFVCKVCGKRGADVRGRFAPARMGHGLMKFTSDRPYGDPEKAARKLIEIANSVEPAQDGRIFIELINWPFLSEHRGSPAEYKAGLDLAITRGWLLLHESGTYVKFTHAGAELFV